MHLLVEISLFGNCIVRVLGKCPYEIRGAKHRALLIILATAPLGRRTREYLQTTLWGQTDYDSGHQNLRRALSDLRKLMGGDFEQIIKTTNTDVEINQENIKFVGYPNDGIFLEDLKIGASHFNSWVKTIRQNPEQIIALYTNTSTVAMHKIRPKVTALPLGVLGNDPSLAILGDWIAEQSCRFLSRSKLIDVISHLSSRAIASKRIFIPEVKNKLGVDFILTGTIRSAQTKILCDLDFIESVSGQILWSKQIVLQNINAFEQLLEQLKEIIYLVAQSIADRSIHKVQLHSLNALEDHQLMITGVTLMYWRTMRSFLQSREYILEATKRMPNMSEPYAWLGKWYALNVFKGFSINTKTDTQKALDYTARALDADPENSFALTIDGFAHNNLLKQMDKAAKRYDSALKKDPNSSLAWLLKGANLAFNDNGKEAIKSTTKALQLSPLDPFGYYFDSLASTAYLADENYEKALEFANRSLEQNDRHLSTIRTKITALHYLGKNKQAQAAAQLLYKYNPNFTLDDYKRTHPGANNKTGQRVLNALSASGIH